MQIESVRFLFELSVILFSISMGCIVLILAIHFIVPKSLIKSYFRPPFFREGEVSTLTGFPFGYIRTVMFLRIVGFPRSGRTRGLENAYKLSPLWFRMFSKITLIAFVLTSVPLIVILLLFAALL